MSIKRVLRSAAKLSNADAIGSSTASQLKSHTAIPEKTTTTKNPSANIGKGLSEFTENPPAKRAKLATRKKSIDSVNVIAIADNIETDLAPPSHNRLAHPHMTNAPLRSPDGSGLITSSKDVVTEVSENQTQKHPIPPRPFSTTEDLLKQACDHLINVDASLKPLIEKYPCPLFSAQGLAEEIDPFESLCSGIMSQQISGAAAASVKKKFIALFPPESSPDETSHPPGYFPSPAPVAASDVSYLRGAGLSQRKAEYIKGLAEHFASGSLTNQILAKATDEEVLERLIAVRGLGRWSVEMFSCFALKRMDVFSTGDLGVQYDCVPLACDGLIFA